ncbi:MAG TPA: L-lactate permease [Reyranella sp.]|nr:L-lactate permease [Reyranella sp.]
MSTALALLPLLLVLVLLASGRTSALTAGIAGLAATVAVSGANGALLMREVPAGLWLSWTVISIIAAGMFFHRCTLARGAPAAGDEAITPRRLWAVCFLLAPFSEAVTGFGVGYIIALAALLRLGLGGIPALLFGLYSQSLVPWGALATGTTVGATLAGLTANQLGLATATLQVPTHVFYLLLYWRFARDSKIVVPAAQKIDDALWTALLLALVWLANRYADAEIAAAAPCAFLLALRFWRGDWQDGGWQEKGRPDLAHLRRAIVDNAPYVALTLALCATRLVPPLRDFLKPLWALRPYANQPSFAPLYAPGFYLVTIGVVAVLAARASLGQVLRDTVRSAWRSCAVTLAFVVMAELYVGSGMAQRIAEALHAAAGHGAVIGVPLFGAMGGFLTGGGSAGNAMLMPMVIALARTVAVDPTWVAAVQNAVCTNLTMLSPIRVTMGLAILALAMPDSALYRRAWPLALPSLVTGVAAILLIL